MLEITLQSSHLVAFFVEVAELEFGGKRSAKREIDEVKIL
jgi:hypothetical protein